MDEAIHSFHTALTWAGSTGEGYNEYERTHSVRARPAEQELTLTADPAFLGQAELLNPEQLLLAAASSCQLLSFLAVAARARLDVVDYADEAIAEMPVDVAPVRIRRVILRPMITLADNDRPRASDDRLRHLTDVAHRECFVAHSLRSSIRIEPTFHWQD
ncbi:MAG: OsmC family protein [Propionibacteriaceae bacterium]